MDAPHREGAIAREPTAMERFNDVFFRAMARALAWGTIVLVVMIFVQITYIAYPAIQAHGWDSLTTWKWDPGKDKYGMLPQIGGTLYSSLLGVAIGSLFGIAVAIFLTQDFLPVSWEITLKNIIELLAAIPSVVYGLWGIFVVIPTIRPVANWFNSMFGAIPIFNTPLTGPGLLPAALVLAIMVLPTVTAISRDAIASVPNRIREAAYGLGATRWEAILGVILPTASRGIYGSIILAFGRAVGETMALAMLMGNVNDFSLSLFAPGNTLASLIANQWPEASATEQGALMYAGLVLLLITMAINVLGTLIINRTSATEVAR
jgi:phosphate transport system permease protein